MVVKFTARGVESVKPVAGRRQDYFDADCAGLVLRVTPAGAKTWSVLYRHRGRLRRLTLGRADAIGLGEARDRAREAIRAAAAGADPAGDKKAARQVTTIDDLVTDYLEKHAKRKKRSWREDDRMLRAYVLPYWKARAAVDLARRDVRELVEAIAARAPVQANRVLSCVRKMFNFALDREIVTSNPAARLGRPGRETARSRVLTADELRTLWREFEGLPAPLALFYKLRLLTAQRGGEVASMRWEDLDLEAGWWTIPGDLAKNGLAHRVPLSPTALQLLVARHADAGETAKGVVLVGARGRRQRSEAAATFTVDDFRGHDLRRTAASLMSGGGVARVTIGKILNHVERGVTAVYDRHGYDAEKRGALDWWDVKLQGILEGAAKVLPFQKGA